MTDQDNRVSANDIYNRTRSRWIADNSKRLPLQEIFVMLLPFFIFVIQIAFFLLSASHTIDMINRVSHGVGIFAAIGFELGMVVLSFMIYQSAHSGRKTPIWWYMLEIILFIMIVLSNLGGSIVTVLDATKVKEFSIQAIWNAYGTLPTSDQIALIIALVFSFSVPIGSLVVGQMIAHMILDSERRGSPLEQKWKRVAWSELYSAFYAAGIDSGSSPREAKELARQMASGFTGGVKPKEEMETPTQIPAEVRRTPLELPRPSIPALPEHSRASASEFPLDSNRIPVENPMENPKRISNASEAAMEAFKNGMTVKDVINGKIAGSSTAYKVWSEFNKDKGNE